MSIKTTRAQEELLFGTNGDGSTLLKLKPFLISIVNYFVLIFFVKIELNIPFYFSSILVWNWTTLQIYFIINASSIIESLHEIQVKGLSWQRPHKKSEDEHQKLSYTSDIADEIHETIWNDSVI